MVPVLSRSRSRTGFGKLLADYVVSLDRWQPRGRRLASHRGRGLAFFVPDRLGWFVLRLRLDGVHGVGPGELFLDTLGRLFTLSLATRALPGSFPFRLHKIIKS